MYGETAVEKTRRYKRQLQPLQEQEQRRNGERDCSSNCLPQVRMLSLRNAAGTKKKEKKVLLFDSLFT